MPKISTKGDVTMDYKRIILMKARIAEGLMHKEAPASFEDYVSDKFFYNAGGALEKCENDAAYKSKLTREYEDEIENAELYNTFVDMLLEHLAKIGIPEE